MQGDSIEEALDNMKEAIQARLESLAEDELNVCMARSF
ncbi:type II toxin-antitoxin system HicB family antitoxin [Methanolobus bombayensis]|nr:type II toxin-antitoxin system HicB family antitoxin [Methanolobus bombayensis]MBP1910429.1 putative RNase H-like HicB family nuclease [Methanolobus bombayensis]